jgi:threonine synthase
MVSDDEILEAYQLIAQHEGVFAEPASAASVAGLIKLHRQHRQDFSGKRIVCILTGSGLKDPDTALKFGAPVTNLPADAKAIAGWLDKTE